MDPLHASLAICGIALVAEALVGYPAPLFAAIGHPVTWLGRAIDALDQRFNTAGSDAARRAAGAFAIAALVLVCAAVAEALTALAFMVLPAALAVLGVAVLASTCLAQRSLDAHVTAVVTALETHGLEAGRAAVAQIVGRDVTRLDAAGVSRAAIESLAESFGDGVVAPAFWLALLGLPGGLACKAINTADSMIGHRTPRYAAFGFVAARLDDAINWPAARLAALVLVAAAALTPGASAGAAWAIAWRDARNHPSPNAGWPEAAMAGALGVALGGPRTYDGEIVDDGRIGEDRVPADPAAVRRALRLYRVACGLEIALVVALALLIARW